MGIIARILVEHDGDREAAAEYLARGLMRGDAATLKAGYSAPNAALVAADAYGLTEAQADALRHNLTDDA